jgi:hypothetical protein
VKRARRLLTVALLGAAVLVAAAGPAGSAGSDPRTVARAAGEDSPWPRTDAVRANVRAIRTVVRDLSAKVELMELSAARYANWEACIRGVQVSEYGDPDRQWGYHYDERNGIGPGYMPGLAVDRRSRPRKEDYLFLNFSRRANCRSNAPLPGGTADPASVGAAAAASRTRPRRPLLRTLRNLERRVRTMKRSARRLLAASERFDEWESCVSWVPVTEYGDPDGKYGYLFGPLGGPQRLGRPGLHVPGVRRRRPSGPDLPGRTGRGDRLTCAAL